MEYSSKASGIVKRFGFESLDDATLRLSEVLLHHSQERLPRPEYPKTLHEVVDVVHERLSLEPYEKPMVNCMYFSKLLSEIGEHFNHDCETVYCHPDYLDNHHHWAVYDRTDNAFRDAAVYRRVFERGSWIDVEKSGVNRNSIPIETLKPGVVDWVL